MINKSKKKKYLIVEKKENYTDKIKKHRYKFLIVYIYRHGYIVCS